jgi:tetratricopeptide (TPR) repeat protein
MKLAPSFVLDEKSQKGYFYLKSAMRKKFFVALILIGLSAALHYGCASSRSGSEVQFGLWASEKNLWDEAIFRWKKAIEADPKSVAAHNNLAVAYEQKGLPGEALKEYELALKIDPGNSFVKSNYKNCQENIQPPQKDAAAVKNEKK